MKLNDLDLVTNPDNIEIVLLSDDGSAVEYSAIAQIVDDVIQQLIDLLVPTTENISQRIVEKNIVLDVKADTEQKANQIKLSYLYDDRSQDIYFVLTKDSVTSLGDITFIINGLELPLYMRGEVLKTRYLYTGLYKLSYNIKLIQYQIQPVLPKNIGIVSFIKMDQGFFKDMFSSLSADYYFPYSNGLGKSEVEPSLFYDLPEDLLNNTFNYVLKSVKVKIYLDDAVGRKKVYSVIREVNSKTTVQIPNKNMFSPKNKILYLYEN